MATSSTYYLNAPTLSQATSVFSDSALTTTAGDGYYRDGAVVRRLISGVLQSEQQCGECYAQCGGLIKKSLPAGVYYMTINSGSLPADTGAIVFEAILTDAPIGMLVQYNGENFNEVISTAHGSLRSTNPNNPTFVGLTGDDCSISGSTFTLDVYNYVDGEFVATGTTETILVSSGDVQLTATSPMLMCIIAPKPSNLPNAVTIKVVVPCTRESANVDFYINCPEDLESFESSVKAATYDGACELGKTQTFYRIDLNSTPGVLQLNDKVFIDKYGRTGLAEKYGAGYYYVRGMDESYDWFRIDSDSIIVELGLC